MPSEVNIANGSPSRDAEALRILVAIANAREAAQLRNALKQAETPFAISPASRLWSATQILAGLPIDAVLLSLNLGQTADARTVSGQSKTSHSKASQPTVSQPSTADETSDAEQDADRPVCNLTALRTLQNEADDVPMLVVGGPPDWGEQVLSHGAADYLSPRELLPEILEARILRAIRQRQQPPRDTAELPQPGALARRPLRVLLVHEDPLIQRLLKRGLRRRGHHVHTMATPVQALGWAERTDLHVDLLVCPQHQTTMLGAQLSDYLRRYFFNLSTLLLTAPEATSAENSPTLFHLSIPYALADFELVIDAIEDTLSTNPPPTLLHPPNNRDLRNH